MINQGCDQSNLGEETFKKYLIEVIKLGGTNN